MTGFNRNSSNISLKYEIGCIFLHYQVKELPLSPGLLSSFMTVIKCFLVPFLVHFLCNISLYRRKCLQYNEKKKKVPLKSWEIMTHM